jgi:hypothetical protein
VVIAVRAVRVVQMPRHEVVDVVTVGDAFVPARRPVDMALWMSAAVVVGRAAGRVLRGHLERVIVDVVAVHVMQMPVVKIV